MARKHANSLINTRFFLANTRSLIACDTGFYAIIMILSCAWSIGVKKIRLLQIRRSVLGSAAIGTRCYLRVFIVHKLRFIFQHDVWEDIMRTEQLL